MLKVDDPSNGPLAKAPDCNAEVPKLRGGAEFLSVWW